MWSKLPEIEFFNPSIEEANEGLMTVLEIITTFFAVVNDFLISVSAEDHFVSFPNFIGF